MSWVLSLPTFQELMTCLWLCKEFSNKVLLKSAWMQILFYIRELIHYSFCNYNNYNKPSKCSSNKCSCNKCNNSYKFHSSCSCNKSNRSSN
mmetsp:Transcript_12091/g.27941  ORF Transcript_12091/g.27941 Transcript_12091/m.27941 type:complete len:91 (-) Transcript_12091:5989-6261(-)